MAEPVRRVRGTTSGAEPEVATSILLDAQNGGGLPRGARRYPGEGVRVWVVSSRSSR